MNTLRLYKVTTLLLGETPGYLSGALLFPEANPIQHYQRFQLLVLVQPIPLWCCQGPPPAGIRQRKSSIKEASLQKHPVVKISCQIGGTFPFMIHPSHLILSYNPNSNALIISSFIGLGRFRVRLITLFKGSFLVEKEF